MHDIIIRNGTVIDGTGRDRFKADIAISDGQIAKVGKVPEAARREIDAAGKLVTLGGLMSHPS